MEQKIPNITRNIILVNVLIFVCQNLFNIDFFTRFGFHIFSSEEMGLFNPIQILTHMFLHANFMHLLNNMIGVYFFGPILEQTLGSKKFIILYFAAGFGACLLNGVDSFLEISKYPINAVEYVQLLKTPMIGASGAVFGILAAFAKLYPNLKMMVFPIPLELKSKYLITLYALFELYSGFYRDGSGIAHFAHIGGLITGLLLIIYWFGWRRKIY
jgi:membrane associated rhomboid family serine protease